MLGFCRMALLLATLAGLSAGCGTTQIIASDPQAFITVDGVTLGRGMASMQKTGLPETANVMAKTEDGRRAIQPMSRSFGWTAGLLGFFTSGICFFACWQYPDTLYVVLPSPPRLDVPGSGGWNTPGGPGQYQDPWLLQPSGWQAPERVEDPAPAPGPTPKPGNRGK
jgi:hypothetical protein